MQIIDKWVNILSVCLVMRTAQNLQYLYALNWNHFQLNEYHFSNLFRNFN